MNINVIYRRIPLSERLCGKYGGFPREGVGCGKPVVRNAALLDGIVMHYGCVKKACFQPTHLCNGCGSFLSPAKIVTTIFRGEKIKGCGLCGTTDIIKLGWTGRQNVVTNHQRAESKLPPPESLVQVLQ